MTLPYLSLAIAYHYVIPFKAQNLIFSLHTTGYLGLLEFYRFFFIDHLFRNILWFSSVHFEINFLFHSLWQHFTDGNGDHYFLKAYLCLKISNNTNNYWYFLKVWNFLKYRMEFSRQKSNFNRSNIYPFTYCYQFHIPTTTFSR